MGLLDDLADPSDLDGMSDAQLVELAAEIRDFLVARVSRTGGHLGPNLGVVELSIALHREFDSPRDVILWDTGHQAYVHKILTGRAGAFDSLRQRGGLSGYPSRAESSHDVIENSHASTALSYADGIAKAWQLKGELAEGRPAVGRHIVAVVGDGSLTGGMAWEALNNIAGADRQVIIVVNDNARSYAPTIGGLADHLASLRTTAGYERMLDLGKRMIPRTPMVGRIAYDAFHGLKKGVKDVLAPQGMFEDLGLKYLGPIDGHDISAVRHALRLARRYPGPVIVHALTEKGHGYGPAEADDGDRFHGIGAIDPVTGKAVTRSGPTWTSVFSDEIERLARADPRLVAITAAMREPVGLGAFARRFPDRVFDVGIAEQHAVTSACGMAFAGLHPVVAVYATFLNRAFDQLLLDAALHRAPVTFVLDRAGITGEDGASHHGIWDLALSGIVPGLRVAAPRDGARLRELSAEAVADDRGPTLVRFAKGCVPVDIPTRARVGELDVLFGDGAREVLVVAVGATAESCVDAGRGLSDDGIAVTVVDPRWVLPISPGLIELAQGYRLVVTVEDGIRAHGVGALLSHELRGRGSPVACVDLGLPGGFLEQGCRDDLLNEVGLDPLGLAAQIRRHWRILEGSDPIT